VGDAYDAAYAAEVLPELRDDEYLGALPRAHVSALMAQAAVTLMPVAWDEAFGLVAAEAQMAGCPVVAYRRGALPEVVADGISGILVDPDDMEALPAAIAAASRLDRRAVRASAVARLGVARMVEAYEAALGALPQAARTVA
jgi:glycosyltransferase involved in cell wall biosynthesis